MSEQGVATKRFGLNPLWRGLSEHAAFNSIVEQYKNKLQQQEPPKWAGLPVGSSSSNQHHWQPSRRRSEAGTACTDTEGAIGAADDTSDD